MSYNFKDKVALITGAASGIGRATALAFANEGANIMIADISSHGEETAALAKKSGAKALFQKCDMSNAEDIKNTVERTVNEFGRLDFAFNNAGIEGEQSPVEECSEKNWGNVLNVNLTSVWHCMRHEIHQMLKQGNGAIVNCSSIAGLIGFPNIAPYSASKHAVIGLTKSAALELATKNIRVNAICPGVIKTPMIDRFVHNDPVALKALVANEPIGRMGEPHEIGDAVLWLCSERSSFVTGVALAVDGGWLAG